MEPQAEPAHPLPAQRAFLVQVHAEAEVAQRRLAECEVCQLSSGTRNGV